MNLWLSWFQSVLPRAGAFRVQAGESDICLSCGGEKEVARIAITKFDGMTGALYLCEACIEAIKTMV